MVAAQRGPAANRGIAVVGLFFVAGLVGFTGWAVLNHSLLLDRMSGTDAALLLSMVITPVLAVLLVISLRRQDVFKLQALAEQKSRFSDRSATFDHMLDHMNQGVMLISRDRVVEVCNRRACDLLQLPPDLMATQPGLSVAEGLVRAYHQRPPAVYPQGRRE